MSDREPQTPVVEQPLPSGSLDRMDGRTIGQGPTAERATDVVRSGVGGLPPLWKCVWRCLTNRDEWEKCRTLSAAAKLLIDEDLDSKLGCTLYDMQAARWMRLVGAEPGADNGTCDAQSGASSSIDQDQVRNPPEETP